jgi:peptide-methionine (R)-S-oxide reductase
MGTRRDTLLGMGALAGLFAGLRGLLTGAPAQAATPAHAYEVTHSEAEWRQLLSSDAFYVLRTAGTERPFSSPLDREKRAGIFECAGCAQPLFSSKTKFESHTGWPSFWQPLEKTAVDEDVDTTFGMRRVEIRCHRCGGHLGHVFEDGPKPTGLRYCMNGVALKFIPA